MRPIGSFLSHTPKVTLGTAEGKSYSIHMSFFKRLIIRIIGLPHIWFRMRTRLLLSIFKKFVPKNATILDGGCGYGMLSLTLAESGFKNITMIDLDPSRVREIKEMREHYPPISTPRVKVGSLTDIPFMPNTFDVVVSSEVVEHIKDDAKAFSELARVTKEEGLLIVTVPIDSKYNKKDYRLFDHERPGYTASDFRELAKNNRLKLIDTVYYMHTPGKFLALLLSKMHYPPLLGLFFYPFYLITLLDRHLHWTEPNGGIFIFRKDA